MQTCNSMSNDDIILHANTNIVTICHMMRYLNANTNIVTICHMMHYLNADTK